MGQIEHPGDLPGMIGRLRPDLVELGHRTGDPGMEKRPAGNLLLVGKGVRDCGPRAAGVKVVRRRDAGIRVDALALGV